MQAYPGHGETPTHKACSISRPSGGHVELLYTVMSKEHVTCNM